ncbi:UNVERIFIED_CONTAM: hypothetical protein Sangu_2218300 [Sesamum angustifolium]|uniref:Uncharacterized protein n=1 Tax=Sesamum angustifolium TaxID=2727405 RepID=A0AAW2LHW8_9LAMI
MSLVYDNWERLVAAVQRKEGIRQIHHAPWRSSSISSISSDLSPGSTSRFDESSKSSETEHEATEENSNWERLVAAVLKREQIQMCRTPSRSSSISSISSDFDPSSASQFDENIKSTAIEHNQSAEQHQPSGYSFKASRDQSMEVKQACFSQRKLKEKAKTWWLNKRDKVYKKYNDLLFLAGLRRSSISGQARSASDAHFSTKVKKVINLVDLEDMNGHFGEVPGAPSRGLVAHQGKVNVKYNVVRASLNQAATSF